MPDEQIKQILDRLDRIDNRLEGLDGKYEPRAVLAERDKARGERIGDLEQKVRQLEEERRWLNRLVMGSVLASVLALVTGAPGFG